MEASIGRVIEIYETAVFDGRLNMADNAELTVGKVLVDDAVFDVTIVFKRKKPEKSSGSIES